LPWTEGVPRSREEILADVLRRGERIRRRRRTATGLAGTLAVLVPVLVFVSLAPGGDKKGRVIAAGPVVSFSTDAASATTVGPTGMTTPPTTGLVVVEPSPPSTVPSIARRGGAVNPEATTVVTTRIDLDDPVLRPAPLSTTIPAGTGNAASPVLPPSTPTTSPGAPPDAALAPCPVAAVKVAVTTDKPAYAPGETVRWTSTLENASGTTCLVSGRAFFHVEDAAGTTVGSFPHTADFQLPVRAEPGRTFTSSSSWDQTNCAAGPCVHVPPGMYTVVADWTEAGPYGGRGSFSIR
jgi:hypothetical protein